MPAPPCLIRIPSYPAPLPVISSFQSPRSSSRPTGFHRQSPRHPTRRAGRMLASHVVPFMSARRGIIHALATHPIAHRLACLLATLPLPITIPGGSPPVGSDCVALVVACSAIPIRPSVPLPFAPLNRHGGRGERRGVVCLLDGSVPFPSGSPASSIAYGRGTKAISFCVLSLWIVWIACPPSYDCRAILPLSARVVIWSGLDQARSFPRLLRIPCGFVFFPQIAPSRSSCRCA